MERDWMSKAIDRIIFWLYRKLMPKQDKDRRKKSNFAAV